MKTLLTLRNRIESIYNSHSMIFGYILRLLFSFFVLLAIRENIGYNTLLSQFWFILAFSFVSAFVRLRFLMLVMAGYAVLQCASLSLGVGVTVLLIMAIMYLLYLRLEPKYGFALLLIPLLSILKVPVIVTLVLAVVGSLSSICVVICGSFIYYMLHYVSINAAVITGYADTSEFTRASVFINGFFTYKEFIYTTIIMILVFLAVYYIRKLSINHANDVAVAIGAGMYIILMLLVSILISTITFQRLRSILIGTVVAFAVSLIAENIIRPLDFQRAEALEFEDEEYYYYVKAVPKAILDKETVNITRISSRKQADSVDAPEEVPSSAAERTPDSE